MKKETLLDAAEIGLKKNLCQVELMRDLMCSGKFWKAIGLLETNCECGLAKGMWTVDLFEFGWRVALREVCCNNAIRRKWNSRTNGEAVMSLGILKDGGVRRCGGSLLCLGKNPDSSTESSTLFPRIKLQQITLNVPRASVSCTTLNNSSLYIYGLAPKMCTWIPIHCYWIIWAW